MFAYSCHGNAEDHCCYVGGAVCEHLEENTVPGRRWACGLFVRYGSWTAVNESPEYQDVGEHWLATDNPFNYCEAFDPGFCCMPEHHDGRDNDRQAIVIKGVT